MSKDLEPAEANLGQNQSLVLIVEPFRYREDRLFKATLHYWNLKHEPETKVIFQSGQYSLIDELANTLASAGPGATAVLNLHRINADSHPVFKSVVPVQAQLDPTKPAPGLDEGVATYHPSPGQTPPEIVEKARKLSEQQTKDNAI